MDSFAFIGNDFVAAEFLKEIIDVKPPAYIITGADRFEGRGQKLTPSPLTEIASNCGIEIIKTDNPGSSEFIQSISSKAKVDFFLVFSFGYILKESFLKIPKRMCVNIHPSLLPKYRGAAPMNRAIMNGEKKTGITFFKMNGRMDAGEIIMQSEIALNRNSTSLQLRKAAIQSAVEMFLKFRWEEDFSLYPQDDAKASFADKIMKSDLNFDGSLNADNLNDRINGLSEYGVNAQINGKRIKIFESEIVETESNKDAGTIEINGKMLIIYCKKGSINATRIQPAGKSAMDGKGFINGYHIKNGDKICAVYLE